MATKYSSKHSDRVKKTYFPSSTSSNTSSRTEPIFSLKVPESKKNKDWYVDYMEYVIPGYSSVIDNYKEMKVAYDVVNNNLEGFKDQIDLFLNPMGENIGQIEEELIPYPKLHNKINVLKGELLKRADAHKVVLLSAKAIKDKDDALLNAIRASVEEEVLLEIQKMQEQLAGMSPEEASSAVEQMRSQATPEDILDKSWQSEWEIFYNKALNYCYYDQDIKTKKLDSFEDVLITDRMFLYSGWRFGKPYLEVRNPLYCGFHKAPNERYIHKSDYFWYKRPITIADIYNKYGEILSQEEIESLGIHTYSSNQRVDKRHNIFSRKDSRAVFDHTNEEIFKEGLSRSTNEFEDKTVGTSQGQGINSRYSKESLVWETHFEFKAFKRLIFLSYTDEFGEQITTTLSDKFEIPKEAEKIIFTNMYGEPSAKYVWISPMSGTEYSAEILWIPRKYEIIRLGTDVYPIFREVPFQFTNIEEPYSSFNLSTFGGIFTARNAKSVSLLFRALPAYFQYIYIKHIQNREMAKYQGYVVDVDVDQIPKALGEDIDGKLIRDPIAVHALYMKKTGRNYYSGSQSSIGSLPPTTRSPGSSGYILGLAQDIFNLQQLLELLDKEIGMAMGVAPQREAMFSENTNVTDNRQAITQSHHITEPYFYIHSEIWRAALNDYLINFRTYCENVFLHNPSLKEHSFHYILPNGTEELLKVTPSMLRHMDIGLFLSNSGNDQKYLDMMLELSHAFAQNAGEGLSAISTLVKSITSGSSPEEVHKLISIEVRKQQERQDQINKQAQEAELAKVREANKIREDFQEHEIEKIVVKEEEHRETEVLLEEMKQAGSVQESDAKINLEREKLAQQDSSEEKDRGVERQKIAAQKAKNKANSS